MESKSTKSIEVTIIMNETEARWLKNVMQNPLWGTMENEDHTDKIMRKMFWDVLSREGIEV